MGSSENIESNYEVLSLLEEDDLVGLDQKGRLYSVKKGSGLSERHLAIYSFIHDQKIIQDIAADYIIDRLKTIEFQKIETGQKAYLDMVSSFVRKSLISNEQTNTIAFAWYNERYKLLVKSGLSKDVAEVTVAIEMLFDPHIPKNYKKIIQFERTKERGIYLLKDRAGNAKALFKPLNEAFENQKVKTLLVTIPFPKDGMFLELVPTVGELKEFPI